MQSELGGFDSSSDVDAQINGTHDFLERKVLDYIEEWYPDVHGMGSDYSTQEIPFEIDWSIVTIKVSARLTRSSGNAWMNGEGDEMEIKISKHLIENRSWERVCETIRHEAIHIWQYQHDKVENGHGASFHMWAEHFGTSVKAEKPAREPKYEIECVECSHTVVRQRACKLTKQTSRYNCGSCGGDLEVTQNR